MCVYVGGACVSVDKVGRQTDGSQRASPAHPWEGRLAEGKGTDPPPNTHTVQLNPTFAARSILLDLKAIGTETEGAVSCHDAAVAASELVAGWQELWGGWWKKRIRKVGKEITFFFVGVWPAVPRELYVGGNTVVKEQVTALISISFTTAITASKPNYSSKDFPNIQLKTIKPKMKWNLKWSVCWKLTQQV